MAPIRVGVVYFAMVFAAGFVLGAIRIFFVAPRVGAFGAVLTELPIMLLIAWFACGFAISWFAVPRGWGDRLAMGVVAFVLLMLAELALAVAVFGGTFAGFVADLGTPEGMVGLVGQVAFGAMPLVRTPG